jgi:colicin import membrane protein
LAAQLHRRASSGDEGQNRLNTIRSTKTDAQVAEQQAEAAEQQQQQAAQQAQAAEQQAERARQQGIASVSDRVAQVSPEQLQLQEGSGRSMTFQVDPQTSVIVDGRQASVSDVQQGADARVS